MQCASCQFENMPGASFCGRCGTTMVLAEAEIDVHPPRAGRFTKRARRMVPVRAISSRVLHPAASAAGRVSNVAQDMARSFPALSRQFLGSVPFWTYVMPGGAQFYLGHKTAGRGFLWSYIGLVFFGLVLYGTFWGATCLGLAFSVHLASITMAADPFAGGIILRLGRSALYGLLLFVMLYLPAGIGASYILDAAVVNAEAYPLQAGDVLLVHHLRAPRRGDVVRYNIPYRQYATGQHAYYYFGGPQIDRVLAVGGETLEVRNGIVYLNGKPSDELPLRNKRVMQLSPIHVPPGSLVILPTATLQAPTPIADQAWRDVCVVAADSVDGIIYWRHQPLSRWGPPP